MKNLMEVLAIGNFIDNEQNYADLIEFWRYTFTNVTGLRGESYVNNQYGNGKEILDGNPIFTSKINNIKGIRIIQSEHDAEEPALSAWMNETTINHNRFEELVIAIQLDLETYTETVQLIKLYFESSLTSFILERYNQKYAG